MENITITLTRDELDTISLGLHYGMNWLRNIDTISKAMNVSLTEEELDAYCDKHQEIWEVWHILSVKAMDYRTKLVAKKEE